jgi:hypothetical protein
MARADKSAFINKAVAVIRASEFVDYSKAAARFRVDHTSVLKRIRDLIKLRQEANSLYL